MKSMQQQQQQQQISIVKYVTIHPSVFLMLSLYCVLFPGHLNISNKSVNWAIYCPVDQRPFEIEDCRMARGLMNMLPGKGFDFHLLTYLLF